MTTWRRIPLLWIAIFVLVLAAPRPFLQPDVLITIPVLVAMVVVHEAGHWVMSLLLGHRVFEVKIGFGPSFRFRLGSTAVTVGLFPLDGYVLSAPASARQFRAKRLAIVAAGPLANAVVLMTALIPSLLPSGLANSLVAVNAIVLVAALLPYQTPGASALMTSDGLALARLLRVRNNDVEEHLATYFAAEAQQLAASGNKAGAREAVQRGLAAYPGSRVLQTLEAVDLLRTGDFVRPA